MILTIDLAKYPENAIAIFQKNVADSLLKSNKFFKDDIVRYWGRVDDENETKKQMIAWCNAEHSLYIQVSTALWQGINNFDLSKLSPGCRYEFEKVVNRQLHNISDSIEGNQ